MEPERHSLFKILKDPTRQKIVTQLYKNGPLTYMDLMNLLEVRNTGKFNYHLKMLADFLEKGEDGKYCLTEKGLHAAKLLINCPTEIPVENKKGNIWNVILIGAIGFALVLINPAFLEGLTGISLLTTSWIYILTIIYAFIVPGALMWLLSIKRMQTHDFRNLAKPPFFTVFMLTCMTAVLAFLHWYIGLRIPLIQRSISEAQWTQYFENGVLHTIVVQQGTFTQLTVWMLPFAGLYPLVGIGLMEAIHRFLKRNT